jgi:hypothetical protein
VWRIAAACFFFQPCVCVQPVFSFFEKKKQQKLLEVTALQAGVDRDRREGKG